MVFQSQIRGGSAPGVHLLVHRHVLALLEVSENIQDRLRILTKAQRALSGAAVVRGR